MEAGKPKHLPPFSSLPDTLICDVLKYLPVKTLLRCRCVCKEWNSIITSQSFINTHLLSQPQGHIFCHYSEPSVPSSSTSDRTQLCSFFPDQSFSLVHKFKLPLPNSSEHGSWRILVGSLDGLLCLTEFKHFGRELHLWNPTIRKWKTLSNTCLFDGKHPKRSSCPKTIAFGLGYRVHNSDYMIIRIAVFQSRSRKLKTNVSPQAEVYSLSTESWKKVDISEDVLKRLMDIQAWQYANLNGVLSWMAEFSDGEGRLYESILSFDVKEEKFREIRLPSDYKSGLDKDLLRIEVYRGSLAVIISGKSKIPDDGNNYVWLWVMEEYGKVDSWTRRIVRKSRARDFQSCYMLLDGRIMFKRRGYKGRQRVELLDVETLEEQQFSLPDFHTLRAFKETLVSPQPSNLKHN